MTITRRDFLKTVGAGVAAIGLDACSGRAGGVGQPAKPIPSSPLLVIVNIDGGNDWLNTMPPLGGANRSVYDQLRPSLRVPVQNLTPIGNDLGLSTDFLDMDILSTFGRVAWIPGIGMPNANLSHFVSIDLWGQGAALPNGTGWLGRFADSAFNASDALRGLTVTSDLPVMLRGASRSFLSITNSSGYQYPAYLRRNAVGSPYDPQLLENGFNAAVTSTTSDVPSQPGYALGAVTGKAFLDATNSFGTSGSLTPRTPSQLYPGDAGYGGGDPRRQRVGGGALTSSLSSQLKLIAQMIAAGLPTQVFFCRLGGFDTHSNQATDHPNLMRALGGSIGAFYADLQSIQTAEGNAQDRMMVMAYSEFGRRVPENDGGTDHGTAGLAFCLGPSVRGGFYGDYPNLGALDGNKNMQFTVDFRSLYATILERWLGLATTTTDTLLGKAYPRLGFL